MAGTNDFVQHNPTEANQEPNSTFAADSLTTGGIGTDAIMPSPWMNARWYQDSTVCAALMQMLANKGFNVSVANLATLITVFANILTDADILPPLVTVAYSPTPAFNASISNGFDIVLGGNVTSSTLTGQNIGQTLTFVITQSSVGGATFIPPTNINGWKPINTVANSVSVQQFIVKEDGSIWPVSIGEFRVDNANGSYIKLPDGTILQWGRVATTGSSGLNDFTVAVTFPIPFPNVLQQVQTTLGSLGSTGGKNKTVGVIGIPTLSGFNAGMAAMVYIGGSGSNFTGAETISWFATGY